MVCQVGPAVPDPAAARLVVEVVVVAFLAGVVEDSDVVLGVVVDFLVEGVVAVFDGVVVLFFVGVVVVFLGVVVAFFEGVVVVFFFDGVVFFFEGVVFFEVVGFLEVDFFEVVGFLAIDFFVSAWAVTRLKAARIAGRARSRFMIRYRRLMILGAQGDPSGAEKRSILPRPSAIWFLALGSD